MAKSKLSKAFTEPLGKNNPVFVQILGICSTLAVTNTLKNTVVMVSGLVFATALSSLTISLFRKIIPPRVRMMVETLVMAFFVIIVDLVLKAYLPDISRQLGPYVGLLITNCILMGRAEAYALPNPPGHSLIDGLASGLGYRYVLLIIAFLRELIGAGSVWGYPILKSFWTNWTIMIMPPGAFFMLAVFIWIVRGLILKPEEAKK